MQSIKKSIQHSLESHAIHQKSIQHSLESLAIHQQTTHKHSFESLAPQTSLHQQNKAHRMQSIHKEKVNRMPRSALHPFLL
jgi:hypothetical protein